ncbi:MAG: T9SS type A sorting domain-containing protein [Ignavibacteria bacterium]|nr:T9SS type A sorting domain-containing protein [Ignavibacteria bacterium]
MKNIVLAALLLLCFLHKLSAQNACPMNFQWKSDIASTCATMTMTMMHDAGDRPYLYVANKEAGLKVYEITALTAPTLLATVPTSALGNLDVMHLTQNGNFLYLALGNSFTNPQQGGMAIIDVTTPAQPVVMDYFIVPGSSSGGGIVKTEGTIAYLGAMQSGLVVLDVTDKQDIKFVSQVIPSIQFPRVPNPNPNLYNARGMEVKNSIVYLCYDAGGVRIINCTNKQAPVETGRWCNPIMYKPLNHPKAYNNIILDDTLAYVAVDYAGMEVLSIKDTTAISLVGWWNPYNAPSNNWFTSPVHANEMHYIPSMKRVFLSTGKSDMVVVDVTNPKLPDSCTIYGGESNGLGTWGIGLHKNQLYLSYICALVPFVSNWTGVKIITFDTSVTEVEEPIATQNSFIMPNPNNGTFTINNGEVLGTNSTLTILNILGQITHQQMLYSERETIVMTLPNGLYSYHLFNIYGVKKSGKLIIEK